MWDHRRRKSQASAVLSKWEEQVHWESDEARRRRGNGGHEVESAGSRMETKWH